MIHFFKGSPASMTTQSLTAATTLAAARCSEHPIKLLAVMLEEDMDLRYAGFEQTSPLKRTIQDVHPINPPRRLPLAFDVITQAMQAADPDGYIVLTNGDICLTNGFYNDVRKLLELGTECVVANRMTMPDIPMYGENTFAASLEVGRKHPGFDCFVFPAAWVSRLKTTTSCVGIPHVMRPLMYNLIALSQRLLILKEAHLTYHFGDDRPGFSDQFKPYVDHNISQLPVCLSALAHDPIQRKRVADFCNVYNEMFRYDDSVAGSVVAR